LSSITYSERIKIETFCELGLTNIQMAERLKRSPSTISYELWFWCKVLGGMKVTERKKINFSNAIYKGSADRLKCMSEQQIDLLAYGKSLDC